MRILLTGTLSMRKFSEGDKVAVLGDTIIGEVKKTSDDRVEIEDQDGFLRIYKIHELVERKCEKSYKIGDKLKDKEASALLSKVKKKPVLSKREANNMPSVIDLHIEMLRDSHQYLTNYEIVQIQMTACRSFIRRAIEQRMRKVVLIHGKGEGVLKSEIHHYLNRISGDLGVNLIYHDASYQSFGMGGATEVVING